MYKPEAKNGRHSCSQGDSSRLCSRNAQRRTASGQLVPRLSIQQLQIGLGPDPHNSARVRRLSLSYSLDENLKFSAKVSILLINRMKPRLDHMALVNRHRNAFGLFVFVFEVGV